MGNKAERCQDLGAGDNKYLLFSGVMYIGINRFEEHREILATSGKTKDQVLVAGAYTVTERSIIVDGEGSMSLNIGRRDSTPTAEHIKSFPDAAGKNVLAMP